jgi:hypothetical protein
LTTALTVTNTTNAALFGVTLELRYPEHLNNLYDGVGIDGGACSGGLCNINDLVTWQLGTLAPGSSQTVTLPPVVTNGTIEGTLITFNANVYEDNNTQVLTSTTAYVGTNFPPAPSPECGDVNGDYLLSNTDAVFIQHHILGLPPSINESFCDVNGDGQCTNTDAVVLQRYLLGLPPGISQTCPGKLP